MADVITGGANELDATKQDLVASFVQRELQAAAKLLPTVDDYSRFAVKGAQSISIPELTSFTAQVRAPGAPCDATALTASATKIDLDQCLCVSWLIDSCEETQSTINAQLEFSKRAASAHGRKVDELLIAEFESATQTAAIGAISRDIVLEMRETLLSANANMNDLYLVVGPDGESDLLKVDEFTRADAYGSSNIPDGMIGRVYNTPIIVSNLVAAGSFYMYEKSSVGIAFQQRPRLASQPEIQYGTGAERFMLDQQLGVQKLRDVLIVKDGN